MMVSPKKTNLCKQDLLESLTALFKPAINVVPDRTWSTIKAIWIPFLHHDYKNKLETNHQIIITNKVIDAFGIIQGELTAPNDNYFPYVTTFFNPLWTEDQVIEEILQAYKNIIETQALVTTDDHRMTKKICVGKTQSNMLITIVFDSLNNIIDAYPLINKETAS